MVLRNMLKLFVLVLLIAVTTQEDGVKPVPKPIIKSLFINSDIKYTYAKTMVYSKILNPADTPQEVNFRVVLPEEAFITGLVMTIKGKSYDAYIKGKEEAKKEYDAAVSAGQGAALVQQEDVRNSKDFTVSVNVEPQDKVSFNLTYEELLGRKNKTYNNVININPQQIVRDLSIVVDIEDVLNITDVKVPAFKIGNEIDQSESENPSAEKITISSNKVRVKWSPTEEEQRKLSSDGLNGKMVVKYDVDASQNPQQILVDRDGYFVHILRNDNLPILPKHVIFVLDVSGSMSGSKIEQLKDAMNKILADLSESDHFTLILFSIKVLAWSPTDNIDLQQLYSYDDRELANVPANEKYVIPATKNNIEKALTFVKSLETYGGTNIMGAIRNGLKLARLGKDLLNNTPVPQETMMIFLTDGQPNSEESDPDKIIKNVDDQNKGVTVFSLGFGYDADMSFLKKLSLSNNGFARRIYEDGDASLQLQNFYKEVASPVLSDIKFNYLPDQVENTTSDGFKNLFSGSDVLVLGKLKNPGTFSGDFTAKTRNGFKKYEIPVREIVMLPPLVEKNRTLGYLEKMWAYKTIKSLLDKNTVSKNSTIENKAKDLSLKYSFVTPLTSLIVVKPNDSSVADETDNNRRGGFFPYGGGFGGAPGISFASSAGAPAPPSFAFKPMAFGGGVNGMVGSMGVPPPLMRPMASPSFPIAQKTDVVDTSEMESFLSTTAPSPPPYIKTNYTSVTWLNQTPSSDGLFLDVPSSLNTTDVIALKEDDVAHSNCSDGNPCKHFIHCTLTIFANDVTEFTPFQCHIDPKYLGVCCPI